MWCVEGADRIDWTARLCSVQVNVDNIDFAQKVLHVAWHPNDDIIAIGAKSQLFLYSCT